MEEKRQKLVWVIFSVFLAIIFEGVLRKWVFPSYQQYFFFMRDPFVIIAYFYAFYSNLVPKQGIIFYLVIFFSITITIFSFFQTLYSHLPWWVIAYSWRTHFLMLPLTLLIGSFVTTDDLKKLFRFTLRLTPVYAILVYFQSINLQNHWLNSGTLDLFRPLGAAEGLIRTEGFFTSSIGNAIFVGMLFVILFTTWISENWSAVVSRKEAAIYAILSTAMIALSGQRTTFLIVGLIIVFGLLLSMFVSRSMLIRFLKPVVSLIILLAVLLIFVFPQHRASISSRFSTRSSEGITGGYDMLERIIEGFSVFENEYADKIPAMGLGIGYSSNAAVAYNVSVISLYSENEWGRHIIELGPFFGFLIIIFRTFMFLYLFFLSLSACIKYKDLVPSLFFALLGPFLLFGQLTGNGIASGFIWFLTGILLALLNKNSQKFA